MAKYSNTKAKINEKITTNTTQAITGNVLNEVLQTMVDSLGADYQFGGLVQPGSSFTAGEQPVVFLATTPGTYTNFGSLVVADGEVALLVWSGTAWSKQTPDIATRTEVSQLGQKINMFSLENILSLYEFAPLQNGTVNGSGQVVTPTSYLNRVITTNIQHNTSVLHLSIADGFRVYLSKYSSDTDSSYIGDGSWMTGFVEIPADSYFRLSVARVVEVSETANIELFASKISIYPSWYDVIIGYNENERFIVQSLYKFSPLQNGSVNGSGQVVTYNRRVITTNIQHNTDKIYLSIADGFRISIIWYSSNTDSSYQGDSGWKTIYTEIPANSYFRIEVAREVENPSETANIELFAYQVLYCSDWYDMFYATTVDYNRNLPYSVQGLFKYAPLQNGTVNGSGQVVTPTSYLNRVITTNIQHNTSVLHLSIADGFRVYLSKYSSDTDSSYIGDSGWMTGYAEIPGNTYFRISVARVIEDSTEVADIELFASKVLTCPDWYDILKKNRTYAFYSCVTPRKIRYIQHRGLVSEAPENSLPAFRLAGEQNAYAVECDVRMTSDNVLVLMHDSTIDRTTDGTGTVNSMTYEQLQNYHIDTGANIDEYTQDELVIPTLEQYIQICAKYGLVAIIEMCVENTVAIEKTLELLYKYNMQNSSVVLTWYQSYVDYIRQLDDNIHIQWEIIPSTASQLESIIENYAKYPNFSIGIDYDDYNDKDWLASMVRKAMSLHLLVNVFTATTATKEGQIAELFPDFITTDLAH